MAPSFPLPPPRVPPPPPQQQQSKASGAPPNVFTARPESNQQHHAPPQPQPPQQQQQQQQQQPPFPQLPNLAAKPLGVGSNGSLYPPPPHHSAPPSMHQQQIQPPHQQQQQYQQQPPPAASLQPHYHHPPSSGPPSHFAPPPAPSYVSRGMPQAPPNSYHHQPQSAPPPNGGGPPYGGVSPQYPPRPVAAPPQHHPSPPPQAHPPMPSFPHYSNNAPPPPGVGSNRPPPRPPPPQSPGGYHRSVVAPVHAPTLEASQLPRPHNQQHTSVPYHPDAILQTRDGERHVPIDESEIHPNEARNATPETLRSTVYAVPRNGTCWQQTGNLPVGLTSQPLAVPKVTQFPASAPPVRCRNCQAYATPHGKLGKCILCQTGFMGEHNVQTGTYECLVTGPYVTRSTPVRPVYVYVLDVELCPYYMRMNVFNNNNGCWQFPAAVAIQSNQGLHVRDNHGAHYVVADIQDDPVCPLYLDDNWSCPDWESLQRNFQAWQTEDPDLFAKQTEQRYAGGAALLFLISALSETGGQATYLTAGRPAVGIGALQHRGESATTRAGQSRREDDRLFQNTKFAESFYGNLAADCWKNHIGMNIVLHDPVHEDAAAVGYWDVATLGQLCHATGGRLIHLQRSLEGWHEIAHQELLSQPIVGFDAVFKVRCSDGLHVKSFLTPIGVESEAHDLGGSPEVELAVVTRETSLSFELEHRVGGIPKQNEFCYIQTALLYTNLQSQRVVRVSTLVLRVTSMPSDVFKTIDLPTLTNHVVLDTLRHMETVEANHRQNSRNHLYYRCLKFFHNYRQYTSAVTSPAGQLILPDRLQLLPLYVMCLHKSPMLAPALPRRLGHDQVVLTPTGDERALYNWHVARATPTTIAGLLVPTLWKIEEDDAPHSLPPSMESLVDDGVYLVQGGGLHQYLYVGKQVSVTVRQQVAHPSSLFKNTKGMTPLQKVVHQLLTTRPGSTTAVQVVYQTDSHQSPGEAAVLSLMMEDAHAGEKDYLAFMSQLQRRMQDKILASKK